MKELEAMLWSILDIFLSFAARHILCEKQGKIQEAYKKLQEGWLNAGDKVPPAEFGKVRGGEYRQLASAMIGEKNTQLCEDQHYMKERVPEKKVRLLL